jgi:hypothetical protein
VPVAHRHTHSLVCVQVARLNQGTNPYAYMSVLMRVLKLMVEGHFASETLSAILA